MTGQELVDYVRNDLLHDTTTPQLWSDDLILRYLVEAENIFCRRTHALLDNESSLAEISLESGTGNYALSAKVIHVYGALVDGESNDLRSYTRRFIPNQLMQATGTPSIFAMDEAKQTLRVYPVPSEAGTLKLRIARLPLNALGLGSSPEIPEQYHLDLCEYAAYRCLKNAEVDGSNLGSATEFNESWKVRISEAKSEYYQLRTGANAIARNNFTGKRK
jgi:hypothetical protein